MGTCWRRWALPTLLVSAIVSFPANGQGLEAGQRCKLTKKLRVLAKENGENKWRMLDAGADVKIKKPGEEWTQLVLLPAGSRAKASTAQIVERCPSAAAAAPATPPVAAPAEAEAEAEAKPEVAPEAKPEAAPAEAPAEADAEAKPEAAREGEAPEEAVAAVAIDEAPEPTAEATPAPVVDEPTSPAPSPAPPVVAAGKDPSLPLVAVLDLRHAPEDESLANALATIITNEVSARSELRAVSRSELQAVVNHQAEQALLGCDSVKCASDIATLVEADLVVTGGVERAGEAYVVSLTLIDPTVPAVKERVEATWRSNPEEIVLLVRPYVDRLFGGANAASYVGSLDVLAPEGAQLFVDGKDVGIAPLGHAITDLSIGVHTLEVAQPGFVTDKRDLVITRGDTTVTRVELMEEPLLSQWWFWTAVGGGAAVAVAAGATVGTVAIIALSAPPATTVSVKSPLPSAVQ